MRLSILVLMVAAGAVLAKDRPTTFAIGGASFQLPSSGSAATLQGEVVQYGPKPSQAAWVQSQSWHHRDVTYTLTVTHLPDRLRPAAAEAVLAGLKRGLIGPPGTGGEPELYEAREVSGYPGFALNLRAGKQRVRARVAYGEQRVVQLTAIGVERAVTADAVTKALDSLALAGDQN